MSISRDTDKLTTNILNQVESDLSFNYMEILTDLMLTTPYGQAIPIELGKKVLQATADSITLPPSLLPAFIQALIKADPGGLWLVLYPRFCNSQTGQEALQQLSTKIPEEHWATNRYNHIKELLKGNK